MHVQALDCRFLTSANGAIGRCEIYLRSAICNRNFEIQNPNLRLRMARVVELDALRQEPLAATLPPLLRPPRSWHESHFSAVTNLGESFRSETSENLNLATVSTSGLR